MSQPIKNYLPTDSNPDRRDFSKKTSNNEPEEFKDLVLDPNDQSQQPVIPYVFNDLPTDFKRTLAPSFISPSPSAESGLTLLLTGKLNSREQELLFRKIRDRKQVITGFSNAEDGEILSVEDFKQKIEDTTFCFGKYFAQFATEDNKLTESSMSTSGSELSMISGSFSGTFSEHTPRGVMRDAREAHDTIGALKVQNKKLRDENFNFRLDNAHEAESKKELMLALSAISALMDHVLKVNTLEPTKFSVEDIDFYFETYSESVKIFRLCMKPKDHTTCECIKCALRSSCSMVKSIVNASGHNMKLEKTRFEAGAAVEGQVYPAGNYLDEIDLTEINNKYNLPVVNKNKLAFEDKMSVSIDPSFSSSVDHPSVDRVVKVKECTKMTISEFEPSKILVHAEKGEPESQSFMNCSSERPSAAISSNKSSDTESSDSEDEYVSKSRVIIRGKEQRNRRPQGLSPGMKVEFTKAMVNIMDQIADIEKKIDADKSIASQIAEINRKIDDDKENENAADK